MSATILIAERTCVDRIRAEGGLRTSFCSVFRGTLIDTVDDTPQGDRRGFDDLLRDHQVVCVDLALLRPLDPTLPDRVEIERCRHNFAQKIAGSNHVWLTVIDGGEVEQARRLKDLEERICDANAAFGERAVRGIVVFIFTEQLSAHAHSVVGRFGRGEIKGVMKVYVMFHRLQLSGQRTTAIAAINVWPTCVARLLASIALDPPPCGNECAGIFVWRSISWGGLGATGWSSTYHALLRKHLLLAENESEDEAHARTLNRTSVSGYRAGNFFDGQTNPSMVWSEDGNAIRDGGFDYVSDAVFSEALEQAGSHVKTKRALETGIRDASAVSERSQTLWTEVHGSRGLQKLRRLKEGRAWTIERLPEKHEKQRSEWGRIIDERRQLNIAREHHRDAAEEIAIARRRHLSLLWRAIIACAVTLFIGQFLYSALSPLRPEGADFIDDISSVLFPSDFWGRRSENAQNVYVIDCSGSMTGTRFEQTIRKLKEVIEALPENTKYCIVFFDHEIHYMNSQELVTATEENKKLTIAELDTWETRGGTDPTEAITFVFELLKIAPHPTPPKVVEDPPSQILLLTDGEFQSRETILNMVKTFNEARGSNVVRVNTVAVDNKAEEEALSKLAKDSGGTYQFLRFPPYDIFAPLGFFVVLLMILAASALGVMIGALVPWMLERWRGESACKAARKSLMGLRTEFGHLANDTQDLTEGSSVIRLVSSYNGAANLQRAIAARAFSVVDDVLMQTQARRETGVSVKPRAENALAVEDRSDLCKATEIPGAPSHDEQEKFNERLQKIAQDHATALAVRWQGVCAASDPASLGHIPSVAIEEALGSELEENLDRVSLEYVLSSLDDCKTAALERIAKQVYERWTDDQSRPCISGRVKLAGGRWPPATLKIHSVKPPTDQEGGDPSSTIVARIRAGLNNHVLNADDRLQTDNIGIIALGFAHEESKVELLDWSDVPTDFDVVLQGNGAA